MCDQRWNGSKDRTVEQNDGFGVRSGCVPEVVDVTIRAEAPDDGGAWWRSEGEALGSDGNFAVVANADTSLLTPDIGPPRTGWEWAEHGTFLG